MSMLMNIIIITELSLIILPCLKDLAVGFVVFSESDPVNSRRLDTSFEGLQLWSELIFICSFIREMQCLKTNKAANCIGVFKHRLLFKTLRSNPMENSFPVQLSRVLIMQIIKIYYSLNLSPVMHHATRIYIFQVIYAINNKMTPYAKLFVKL